MTPVESLMRSLETGLPSQYDDDHTEVAFHQRFPGGVWLNCPVFVTHNDGLSSPKVARATPPDTSVYLRTCRCGYHRALRTLLDFMKPNAKPVPRLYSRVIERCGQCHCFCPGTQFVPAKCSRLGVTVFEHLAPPGICPLPMA